VTNFLHLSTAMTLNDLKPTRRVLLIFLAILAAAHILTANCD